MKFKGQFIVGGIGRSGTTAVVKILSSHSDVIEVPDIEMPYLHHYLNFCQGIGEGSYSHAIFKKNKFDPDGLYKHFGHQIEHMIMGDFSEKKLQNSQNLNWVGKCNIFNEDRIQIYKKIFNNPKFVVIIRNALEVVPSRMKFQKDSFKDACIKWSEYVSKQYTLKSNKDVLMLRHEKLLSNPSLEVTKLLKHFELDRDEKPYNTAELSLVHPTYDESHAQIKENNAFDILKTDVKCHFEHRKKEYTKWSQKEKNIFKDTCCDMMNELSYEIPF